jgi:hypothetical protein
MKKNIALLVAVLFSGFTTFAQTAQKTSDIQATFCGIVSGSTKPAAEGPGSTAAGLRKCDWKIYMADSNYTVSEFKMSLVPKKKGTFKYEELSMRGNIIPEEYRSKILTDTRYVYLEYIRAINKQGEYILVKPISVRMAD